MKLIIKVFSYNINIEIQMITLSGVRFQMLTLCPEFNKFLTIPDPILPKPMNPNDNFDGTIFLVFITLDISLTLANGVLSYNNLE